MQIIMSKTKKISIRLTDNSRENFRKLYMLADNIGAQVGASRAAVAAGDRNFKGVGF